MCAVRYDYLAKFQIGKNRFDGQLGRFTLRFDKERLSFSRSPATRDDTNIESNDNDQQQSIPVEQ